MPFNQILLKTDVNVAWNMWYTMFIYAVNLYAPYKTKRIRNDPCPWLNGDIFRLMHARDAYHRHAVKTNSSVLWNRYKQLRNLVTRELKSAKDRYLYDSLNCNSGKVGSGGSRGGGPNRPRPPLFSADCFFFFFFFLLFTPEVGSGRRTVPLPHNVNDEKNTHTTTTTTTTENSESPPPPPPPLSDFLMLGAASRHLDSRPSLFTNPGSATGWCYMEYIKNVDKVIISK